MTNKGLSLPLPSFRDIEDGTGIHIQNSQLQTRNALFTICIIPVNSTILNIIALKGNDMERNPCVYIMTNKPHGTLYTGVTSNLPQRSYQHKHHLIEGFTKQHNLTMLIWYEQHTTMDRAILREQELKKWRRQWKITLIENLNPEWNDLYSTII